MEQNQNNQPKMPKFNMNWVYLIAIAALAFFFFSNGSTDIQGEKEVTTGQASYSEFKNFVKNGYAERIVVNKSTETLKMPPLPMPPPPLILRIRNIHRNTRKRMGNRELMIKFRMPLLLSCS